MMSAVVMRRRRGPTDPSGNGTFALRGRYGRAVLSSVSAAAERRFLGGSTPSRTLAERFFACP